MTGNEFMKQFAIRERASDAIDTGYTDGEIVFYINSALNLVWRAMIKKQMPEVIGDIKVVGCNGNALPHDFLKPTSKVPMVVRKNRGRPTFEFYGDLPYKFRYYRTPPMLETMDDELPYYDPSIMQLIAQMVTSLMYQNHAFDTSQEDDFTNAIIQLL